MSRDIFINLPVKNLERSVEFFTKIGFDFNKQFTDENGTMMIVNDKVSVMLLTEKFFQSFSKKTIVNTEKSSEVIVALTAISKDDVDKQATKIKEAGGIIVDKIEEMDGAMYGIRFEDLDGHLWELFYMDMEAFQQ
ncbi:MAG: VOC family protein [Dysgonomonas sp.]|nr:VOC family protein [Dysgonomonas sp.]